MSTRTTQHLRSEHRQANRLLSAFRRYLHELEESKTQDSREPSGLIDFLAESLFQKHEEKEEGLLLPELARMGLSWSDGALAEVRRDHRQGRYLLRSLRHAMRQGDEWSADARAHFLSIAKTWVEFLHEHMQREEKVIFPFIDSRLEEDSDEQLVKQFEAIDREYAEMRDAAMLAEAGEAFVKRYSRHGEESGSNARS
jgi:hemerythrin-like domain-containing protein